jgi:geranylgeranyl pyrophosphate synthase
VIRYELNAHVQNSDLPGGLDLLNEFALSGGKKFRPRLVTRLAECLGLSLEQVTPFAIASERIHCATLLHDDVIDESSVRRGKATLNAQGENRKAVLGGDLLLAETLRDLSTTGDAVALRELFLVLVELAEGEWLQLEARNRADVEWRHLREVAKKKTGSLIGWCCWVPAHLAHLETSENFKKMGIALGVAFQMLDDCIDFDSTSGKPFANDILEGQVNFVIQNLLSHDPSWREDLFSQKSIDRLRGPESAALASSIEFVLNQAEVELAVARDYLARSQISPQRIEELEREIIDLLQKQATAIRERLCPCKTQEL